MGHAEFRFTVKADEEDVTPWVRKLEVVQTGGVHREFNLWFAQHHTFAADAVWDVYGTYDPAESDDEPLIRRGIVPVDRPLSVDLKMTAVPDVAVKGYEYVWLATRTRPDETLVLTHSRGRDSFRSARDALDGYRGPSSRRLPVGRHRVRGGIRTLHQAVAYLGRRAGVNVEIRMQDYPFTTVVVGPERSYWDAITQLVNPFAPLMWYRRMDNTLMISDSVDYFQSAQRRLEIPGSMVETIRAVPRTRRSTPSRVIVRFPRWRW